MQYEEFLMTDLKSILQKDIDRKIDGVIKADDDTRILQEIDEYVITREIKKHLDKLIEGYSESIEAVKRKNNYPYNGVWISGYFGSGKSHLLKMLAYLFENKEVEGKKLSNIFLDKIEDGIARANFEKIFAVPSKSILFNIDQQSDAAKSDDENAILFIFERVFNKMQGFFPESRAIAEFERHLTEEGSYETFKSEYWTIIGQNWLDSRSKAFGIGRSKLKRVLTEGSLSMSEEDSNALIDVYKGSKSLSIEDFAGRVKIWLDAKEDPGFRLNFFIDEVGQFIANKPERTLNLQTIAETMATVCKGRVWIFVTSQEDLQKVVGDPTASQVQDYSKIHARFYFRVSLSSADVQEVIQKRLLVKTENGSRKLGDLFENESETFRTIFKFDHGGKNIQFKNKEQFILSYPFQAYQYNLLQESLRELSQHNAFMGRHVSKGERSMLEIFQDVAKDLKDKTLYHWATFDQMFKGIKSTLNTDLLNAVNVADRELTAYPVAVKLLKILLLVKYVRDFKSTKEHLKILLINSPEQDLEVLDLQIEEALAVLEKDIYIQRNGDLYEYLTNEEQDVEQEIKQVSVSYDEIRKFIDTTIFSGVLKTGKIRYSQAEEDFAYKKIIDGEQSGHSGTADLAIHLVTPFYPNYKNEETVLNHSMGKKECIIFLAADDLLVRELRLYFQTDVYCRQQIGSGGSSLTERIIRDKQILNGERKSSLIKQLQECAGQSNIYVMGEIVSVKKGNPKERIEEGFQSLVRKSYPKLQMLSAHYVENSLNKIFYPDDHSSLYSGGVQVMDEAEKEMWAFIQRKFNSKEYLSLKILYEEFGSKQYGWYFWGISCVLAKLFVRDSIEFIQGNKQRSRDEVFVLLSHRKEFELTRVIPSTVIDQTKLEEFRKLYKELFYKDLIEKKMKGMAIIFKQDLLSMTEELENWQRHEMVNLPFLSLLTPIIDELKTVYHRDNGSLIEEMHSYDENLIRLVHEDIDPLKTFMKAKETQYATWKELLEWYEENSANLHELSFATEAEPLKKLLGSVPYKDNNLRNAKKLVDGIREKVRAAVEARKEEGKKKIDELKESLQKMAEYGKLSSDKQIEVMEPLTRYADRIVSEGQIKDIKLAEYEAKDIIPYVRERIHIADSPDKPVKIVYATEYEKNITFPKVELVTEEDVLNYTDAFKKRYLSLIAEHKRIGL
jgi:hypothetical protein